jgi:hypothetical protein
MSFARYIPALRTVVLESRIKLHRVPVGRCAETYKAPDQLGVKAAEVRARMADIDPASLPSVEEARARQQARAAEIEKTQSQAPATVDLRPVFTSAANRTTEPAAPIFDRDAAEATWTEQLTAAAIAHDVTARQTPEAEREGEAHQLSEGGIPRSQPPSENAPAPTATRQIVASEPEAAKSPESELRSPDRAAGRIFGGLAKVAETILGGLFSFFGAAEPKLTKQQAHEKAQARGNEETLHAEAVAERAQGTEIARDWDAHALKSTQQEKSIRLTLARAASTKKGAPSATSLK